MNSTIDSSLKKIQQAELYLLVEFDKVCRELGLTYFLDSGTALGAVRHGGFIPWDDDIDVGMPRKDYERFMQIGQTYLPDSIFLQNSETEKNYARYAAKLRLKGTVFPESNGLPYKYNGIFLDIFPFDNVPGRHWLAVLNVRLVVGMLHVIRLSKSRDSDVNYPLFNKIVSFFLKKMPSAFVKRLESLCLGLACRRQERQTGFITCYFWRMSQTKQYLFDIKKMFPVVDISFEGHNVRIMSDPDYYLRLMYGDYMKLPPEKDRVVHRRANVDFGSFDFDKIF